VSYYDDGGEIEYGDDDDGHQCGRCRCALSDLELADAITDDDGEVVCAECQKEAQERSCAERGRSPVAGLWVRIG
jgi:hypothetical protein